MTRQQRRVVLFGALLVAVALPMAYLLFAPPTGAERRAQEDSIREAVFRHMFEEYNAPRGKIFFLSAEDTTLSDAFLRRFHDSPHVVRRSSDSKAVNGSDWVVREKRTGRPGIAFTVGPIVWRTSGSVRVEGEWYVNGLSAARYRFRVVWEGRWMVRSEQLLWVS